MNKSAIGAAVTNHSWALCADQAPPVGMVWPDSLAGAAVAGPVTDEDGAGTEAGKELGGVGSKVLEGIRSGTSVVSGSSTIEVVVVGSGTVMVVGEPIVGEPIVEGGLLDGVG